MPGEQHQAPAQPRTAGLNPMANTFTFSPTASTFTPSFAAAPVAPPAQQHQPPAPAVPPVAPAASAAVHAAVGPAVPSEAMNGIAPMDEDVHEEATSSGRGTEGVASAPELPRRAAMRFVRHTPMCYRQWYAVVLHRNHKGTAESCVQSSERTDACAAGVDDATEAVNDLKVSPDTPSPSSTPARHPSPAPQAASSHSPGKHEAGG